MAEEAATGYGEFEYANGASYIGHWVEREGVKRRHGHGKFLHAPITVPALHPSATSRPKTARDETTPPQSAGSKEPEDDRGRQPIVVQEEYEGEWAEDTMQGYGVYHYASGALYEGEWQSGQQNGHGTYYFPNGAKYEGFWEHHRMNGKGVYTDPTGVVWEGVFVNGSFDSSIQKRLRAEFEESEKVRELERQGPMLLAATRKAFAGDKKTWKEAFMKNLVTVPEEVDKFVAEPYCRLEDRNLDKWNDVLGQLMDVTPRVLRRKTDAACIAADRVYGEQLKGPGQILEFTKRTDVRRLELCLVLGESQKWVIFHCLDAKA